MLKRAIRNLYLRVRPHLEAFDRYITEGSPQGAEPVQIFRYAKPGEEQKGVKEVVLLCKSDHMRGAVHVVRQGSAENLHSHQYIDGLWVVLAGKARFHGEAGVVYGELGPLEGILVPRNTPYWFESADGRDLELLQVLSLEPGRKFDRQNHARRYYDRKAVRRFDARADARQISPEDVESGATAD